MAYNKRKHLADNLSALEYVFMNRLSSDKDESLSILRSYTGFGALKCILNPAEKDEDIDK